MKTLLSFLLALATQSFGVAQSDWSIATTTGPGARTGHAMAYDGFRDVVVLFGGVTAAGAQQNDTWEFDGTSWTQVFPATTPPGRDGHAMTFHRDTGAVFLFGGDSGASNLDDTWQYDGIDWLQLSPATVPPARNSHAIAYDAFRGRVVMFGGDDNGALGDTWQWDQFSQDWVPIVSASSPAPRFASAMEFSLPFGSIVLYSGDQMPADTWSLDGNVWQRVFPANNPGPRHGHTLTVDDYRHRVVLFGSSNGVSDTWEWDGFDWVQRTPGVLPSARIGHAAVFDARRERCVLHGGGVGNPETWVYENPSLAAHEVLGAGCAGSNGTPRIAAGSSLPWTGETFSCGARNLPIGPFSMVIGFQAASIDLDFLGMTNCDLLVSPSHPIVTVPLVNPGGGGAFELPLGDDPILVGLEFFYQAFCVDPGANPFGATTSDAGHGTVGVK